MRKAVEKTHWSDMLDDMGACRPARQWAKTQPTMVAAWRSCPIGAWLDWFVYTLYEFESCTAWRELEAIENKAVDHTGVCVAELTPGTDERISRIGKRRRDAMRHHANQVRKVYKYSDVKKQVAAYLAMCGRR